MEIFNAMRTHNPPSATTGPESSHRSVQQSHKSTQQQMREEVQESGKKADTQKLKKELQEITDQLNKEMNPLNTTIRFGFNDKAEELYVSVIDTSSNQEIRKIPSEEAMRLASKMRELVGMIFDKKG